MDIPRAMGVFRLLARVTIGLLFAGHGAQKLFGWFGGGGPEATGKSFESLGLSPGRKNALAAGVAETCGGLLFAAGAATPVAAAALSGVMITAIRAVHWEKGVWVTKGGYEYNLVLLAAVFGLTENGPGTPSLDALFGKRRWGTAWAFAALIAGAVGAAGLAGAQDDAGAHDEAPDQSAEKTEPAEAGNPS